jgi:acyl-CoA thioesterase I
MRVLLMLTTVTLLASPAAGQAAGPSPRPVPSALKVVAFGDSLTSGHRLPRRDAYPAQLEAELQEAGLPVAVINHGVSGDTTSGGLRRLDAALAERPQILIVAFGANDGLLGVPVAQVRVNLEKIITAAQARGIAVLLVGMEALPLYGWQYTVDFHNMFPAIADKYKVPLVPFMLNGVLGNPDLMTQDGVHPNAAGAKMMAANIYPYVEEMARSMDAAK